MSRWIGTLQGQLEDDPFMEILQRQGDTHPATSIGAVNLFEKVEPIGKESMRDWNSFNGEEVRLLPSFMSRFCHFFILFAYYLLFECP